MDRDRVFVTWNPDKADRWKCGTGVKGRTLKFWNFLDILFYMKRWSEDTCEQHCVQALTQPLFCGLQKNELSALDRLHSNLFEHPILLLVVHKDHLHCSLEKGAVFLKSK